MALMRLFMRARREHGAGEDPLALFNFSRLLIKASEHTWGTDGRCMEPGMGDLKSWSNTDFEKVRPTRECTSNPPPQYDLQGHLSEF